MGSIDHQEPVMGNLKKKRWVHRGLFGKLRVLASKKVSQSGIFGPPRICDVCPHLEEKGSP